MMPVRCLLILFASFLICQPVARAEALTVKVVPRNGKPMILSNFTFGWSRDTLDAVWNQQEIEIPIKNIKSIRSSDAQADEGDNAKLLDVEVTLKTGENSRMKMKNFEFAADSQFGKLQLDMAHIALLEFEPDMNQAETNRPPAAKPRDGGGEPPSAGKPSAGSGEN